MLYVLKFRFGSTRVANHKIVLPLEEPLLFINDGCREASNTTIDESKQLWKRIWKEMEERQCYMH
jgi:hypothetical protein